MKLIYKTILFLLFLVLITGCGTKRLTVKSLHPSKIPNEKIHSIYIEDFVNDNLYQSLKIQNKLANKNINGKNVFKVLNNYNKTDARVEGIVDSSLNYYTYYEEEIDYRRCRSYRYEGKKGKKGKRKCMEYHVRLIPCENRVYNVQTNIKVLKDSTSEILFAKTYNRSRSIRECFRHHYYAYHTIPRNKREINTKLADLIASDFLDDISPHYVYFDINMIEELNEKNLTFTDNQNKRFEKVTELMENRNLELSLSELEKLNQEFNYKSYEVLYNMGLIYEANANLFQANKLYKEAKLLVNDLDNLSLINAAVLRTKQNLEEKIKAKSQLP
ncbi:hypothetical protein [Arcobacter peruensis]|uniref:hypothetical protein n=1 Tax=Arcobacter peruensis TaxID=2320140 RepID=UPI000F090B3E|nr:hypothetical protein [Arcobacter peruensis]